MLAYFLESYISHVASVNFLIVGDSKDGSCNQIIGSLEIQMQCQNVIVHIVVLISILLISHDSALR